MSEQGLCQSTLDAQGQLECQDPVQNTLDVQSISERGNPKQSAQG